MNTVTVTFSQDDLNALTSLIDAAVKAQGLQATRPALIIMSKLEAAVQAANAPAPAETGEGAA